MCYILLSVILNFIVLLWYYLVFPGLNIIIKSYWVLQCLPSTVLYTLSISFIEGDQT